MNIIVDHDSPVPIYKQLVKVFQDLVLAGEYKEGDRVPSMNDLSIELDISKETVQKAYSILREMEIFESIQGKGFYISGKKAGKIKTLLLFDKISTYKQVLFNSFVETIGASAEITIHLHNQDINLFEFFIEENLDKFDYYLITPHFPLNPDIQKRAVKILKKIPNRKLLLLDRNIKELQGNFGSVYQDFEEDIFDGLSRSVDIIKKYKRLNVISMPGSMYAPLIIKGIEKFSKEKKIDFKILENINIEKIQKQDSFLILNGQLDIELIELMKSANLKGLRIGKDIGIISYNESPINEIILNGLTVFSTDFKQMGKLAATMILEKSLKKIRCNFNLIRRSTF
jgi:DNA-binding transcriptional regulator YhcF (GntR family)